MLVKELIAKLQKVNPEAEVFTQGDDGNGYHPLAHSMGTSGPSAFEECRCKDCGDRTIDILEGCDLSKRLQIIL